MSPRRGLTKERKYLPLSAKKRAKLLAYGDFNVYEIDNKAYICDHIKKRFFRVPSRDYLIKKGSVRKRKLFTTDVLHTHWASGKPITYLGKKYRVGKMSYGVYFLEPAKYRGGERDLFHPQTIWLRQVVGYPYFYEIKR